MYYGCSPVDPIYMQVLDLNTLEARTEVVACFNSDKENHGWERTGELNELSRRPYIEGAWMTAHQGKYYLQYAAPGTEWKSYADGVYVGTSPAGPLSEGRDMVVSLRPVVRTIGKPRPIQFLSGICLNAGYLSIRPALIKTAICLRTPI